MGVFLGFLLPTTGSGNSGYLNRSGCIFNLMRQFFDPDQHLVIFHHGKPIPKIVYCDFKFSTLDAGDMNHGQPGRVIPSGRDKRTRREDDS